MSLTLTVTLTVTLPDALHAFVAHRVATGGYTSPDEYVHALIRGDWQRTADSRLEAELAARLDQSDSVLMDRADFERMRRELVDRLTRAALRADGPPQARASENP